MPKNRSEQHIDKVERVSIDGVCSNRINNISDKTHDK